MLKGLTKKLCLFYKIKYVIFVMVLQAKRIIMSEPAISKLRISLVNKSPIPVTRLLGFFFPSFSKTSRSLTNLFHIGPERTIHAPVGHNCFISQEYNSAIETDKPLNATTELLCIALHRIFYNHSIPDFCTSFTTSVFSLIFLSQ